jgi:hypothetical protein
VLLHEAVGEMLRLLLLLFLTNYLCGDFVGYHCIVLQLPSWGDFLLHHAASVAVVGVTWIENWGGQDIGGQRRVHMPKGGTSSFTKLRPWSGGGMDKGK